MTDKRDEFDLCISCHKNTVGWPRICNDCKDHEAQAQLALDGYETCRTCGMYYDGGMRCTYCGDSNPLDNEDENWDMELEEEL